MAGVPALRPGGVADDREMATHPTHMREVEFINNISGLICCMSTACCHRHRLRVKEFLHTLRCLFHQSLAFSGDAVYGGACTGGFFNDALHVAAHVIYPV